MWMILDLFVVAAILFSTFMGYKRGLIGVIFKIVSFFIALIVATALVVPVSNLIMNNTTFVQKIEDTVYDKMSHTGTEEEPAQSNSDVTSKAMVNFLDKGVAEVKDTGAKAIASLIATTAIKVIVFLAVFVIVRVVLMFFKAIFEAIAKLPIIKQFNKLGGTVYGLLRALVILYVIFGICSLLAPMINNTVIADTINSSYLASFMYHRNILLMLLF